MPGASFQSPQAVVYDPKEDKISGQIIDVSPREVADRPSPQANRASGAKAGASYTQPDNLSPVGEFGVAFGRLMVSAKSTEQVTPNKPVSEAKSQEPALTTKIPVEGVIKGKVNGINAPFDSERDMFAIHVELSTLCDKAGKNLLPERNEGAARAAVYEVSRRDYPKGAELKIAELNYLVRKGSPVTLEQKNGEVTIHGVRKALFFDRHIELKLKPSEPGTVTITGDK